MTDTPDRAGLADPVAQTVRELADLHQAHYSSATPLQKAIDATTDILGRPTTALLVILGLAVWGFAAWQASGGQVTAAPFVWLEIAGTMLALAVALLILVTQRRQDQLAERRSQLALELALLADKRTAKVIALLEELRRDAPGIADRIDAESDDMARAADPSDVPDAIADQTRRKRR